MKRLRISPSFVISLVALFVALGGTAWAATGGNFILGKANTANAKTTLTGTNAGPALALSNTTTGTAATALNLNVASGHAPLTTNSSTVVKNLNADKVDGLDAVQLKTHVDLVWTTTGPFTNAQTTFTSNGGPLLITLNGSAYGDITGQVLVVCVYIDGAESGACGEIAENEALSHKALVPVRISNGFTPAAGQHTVTLKAFPGYDHTKSDSYDVYSVTILELP
jgi:hypothetical protein